MMKYIKDLICRRLEMQQKLRMDYLNMQQRAYNPINNFSVSSFEFDRSEDELSEEEDFKNFRNFRPASGSRIIHRWLLNIIDIPNNVSNRLRDWLRSTNGGSTSDKSSGTNSITSKIRLTEYSDNDGDFYNEKVKNSLKKNHRYTDAGKKLREPFDDHRYSTNHHVYHIYKQNKMGIKRVVREQRNYSTSWLQQNGRFSSSPILVLPRINPDTGLPIIQPKSHHSRTSTERQSLKHHEKKGEGWRNSKILQFQENHYTQLKGDSNLIEKLLEKPITKKTLSTANKNSKQTFYHNQNNHYEEEKLANLNQTNREKETAFLGSISTQQKIKKPSSLFDTIQNKNFDLMKNDNKAKIDNTHLNHFSDLQCLSTVTQNNVDALLNNLRQKVDSLNAEKKANRSVVHMSNVIDPDTGSRDRSHLLEARWQDKSGLFAKRNKPSCTKARASFTERIQDIWTQEKSSSQWDILHNPKNLIYGPNSGNRWKENVEKEKKTIISDTTTNEMSNNDRVLKISATQCSMNHEMAKPTVCDVGVQYSNLRLSNLDEDLRIYSSKYIPTLDNNENKTVMQIPEINEASTEPKEIPVNIIQLSPQKNSQGFLKHEISEVANDFNHSNPAFILESKENTKSLLLNDQKDPMNIYAKNFAFSPEKIKADVQNEKPEIIITERHDISEERSTRKIPNFLNISSHNINNRNLQIAVHHQQQKLRCPFKHSPKNPVNLFELTTIDESFTQTENNLQSTFSACMNDCMNSKTENSQFSFMPQKIRDEVQYEIPEITNAKVRDRSDEPNPQKTPSFLSLSSQDIKKKKSQITLQRQRKRLHCPFKGLRKNRVNPTSHLSRSTPRNTRKSRIFTCQFSKKVGLWLSNKFHLASRQNRPISCSSSGNFPSKKSSKLTCTMRSIFKCIEKTSELNVPQVSMLNKECQIPTIHQMDEKQLPPIKRKKHEAQSSKIKNDNVAPENEKNTEDALNYFKCTEIITPDLIAIEPAMNGNRRTPSKRSMTTLSVTTSNLTNIPPQLLGSTSDTNIVPSRDSKDDFKRQVDQSNATEIITRNRTIETCEETDHYNSDSLLPEIITEVNEKTEKLDYNKKKKINDFQICNETKYYYINSFLPEGSAEIKEKLKNNKPDYSRKIENFETGEETDHYISDLLLPKEVDKKIKKSTHDDSKKIDKVKTLQKSRINFSTVNAERKLNTEEKPRQPRSIGKTQQLNSFPQNRKRDNAGITRNIDEKRSCDVQIFSEEKNKLRKIKTSVSDKNTVDRNAQKLRLNRRQSRIDIVVDKSTKKEHKGEKTEIRNVHNKISERRESQLNIGVDDISNDGARLKRGNSLQPYNSREIRSIQSESKNPPRKLRQRMDSPVILCKATDLQKRKSIAAGKSSLIPIGIGNSRYISTLSKNNEKITAHNSCNKKKLNENKNEISGIDSSPIARPSLKNKSGACSDAKEKKNVNYRVRFDLKKKSSNKMNIEVNNDEKKDTRYSENVGIDDKRIIKKIKSSLENGEPLKRIKITEPGLISKRTSESCESKCQVEKDVIDQPGETCSSNQNLLRRKRMNLISGADNENVYQTYPHRESMLSEQIPKARGSFEKRHMNENKTSYRSPLIEKRKNNYGDLCPAKENIAALPKFMKTKNTETSKQESIIDFSRIKEQVENEILEQTSRSSGTEDLDCAIVLIKAINSSMELSDA